MASIARIDTPNGSGDLNINNVRNIPPTHHDRYNKNNSISDIDNIDEILISLRTRLEWLISSDAVSPIDLFEFFVDSLPESIRLFPHDFDQAMEKAHNQIEKYKEEKNKLKQVSSIPFLPYSNYNRPTSFNEHLHSLHVEVDRKNDQNNKASYYQPNTGNQAESGESINHVKLATKSFPTNDFQKDYSNNNHTLTSYSSSVLSPLDGRTYRSNDIIPPPLPHQIGVGVGVGVELPYNFPSSPQSNTSIFFQQQISPTPESPESMNKETSSAHNMNNDGRTHSAANLISNNHFQENRQARKTQQQQNYQYQPQLNDNNEYVAGKKDAKEELRDSSSHHNPSTLTSFSSLSPSFPAPVVLSRFECLLIYSYLVKRWRSRRLTLVLGSSYQPSSLLVFLLQLIFWSMLPIIATWIYIKKYITSRRKANKSNKKTILSHQRQHDLPHQNHHHKHHHNKLNENNSQNKNSILNSSDNENDSNSLVLALPNGGYAIVGKEVKKREEENETLSSKDSTTRNQRLQTSLNDDEYALTEMVDSCLSPFSHPPDPLTIQIMPPSPNQVKGVGKELSDSSSSNRKKQSSIQLGRDDQIAITMTIQQHQQEKKQDEEDEEAVSEEVLVDTAPESSIVDNDLITSSNGEFSPPSGRSVESYDSMSILNNSRSKSDPIIKEIQKKSDTETNQIEIEQKCKLNSDFSNDSDYKSEGEDNDKEILNTKNCKDISPSSSSCSSSSSPSSSDVDDSGDESSNKNIEEEALVSRLLEEEEESSHHHLSGIIRKNTKSRPKNSSRHFKRPNSYLSKTTVPTITGRVRGDTSASFYPSIEEKDACFQVKNNPKLNSNHKHHYSSTKKLTLTPSNDRGDLARSSSANLLQAHSITNSQQKIHKKNYNPISQKEDKQGSNFNKIESKSDILHPKIINETTPLISNNASQKFSQSTSTSPSALSSYSIFPSTLSFSSFYLYASSYFNFCVGRVEISSFSIRIRRLFNFAYWTYDKQLLSRGRTPLIIYFSFVVALFILLHYPMPSVGMNETVPFQLSVILFLLMDSLREAFLSADDKKKRAFIQKFSYRLQRTPCVQSLTNHQFNLYNHHNNNNNNINNNNFDNSLMVDRTSTSIEGESALPHHHDPRHQEICQDLFDKDEKRNISPPIFPANALQVFEYVYSHRNSDKSKAHQRIAFILAIMLGLIHSILPLLVEILNQKANSEEFDTDGNSINSPSSNTDNVLTIKNSNDNSSWKIFLLLDLFRHWFSSFAPLPTVHAIMSACGRREFAFRISSIIVNTATVTAILSTALGGLTHWILYTSMLFELSAIAGGSHVERPNSLDNNSNKDSLTSCERDMELSLHDSTSIAQPTSSTSQVQTFNCSSSFIRLNLSHPSNVTAWVEVRSIITRYMHSGSSTIQSVDNFQRHMQVLSIIFLACYTIIDIELFTHKFSLGAFECIIMYDSLVSICLVVSHIYLASSLNQLMKQHVAILRQQQFDITRQLAKLAQSHRNYQDYKQQQQQQHQQQYQQQQQQPPTQQQHQKQQTMNISQPSNTIYSQYPHNIDKNPTKPSSNTPSAFHNHSINSNFNPSVNININNNSNINPTTRLPAASLLSTRDPYISLSAASLPSPSPSPSLSPSLSLSSFNSSALSSSLPLSYLELCSYSNPFSSPLSNLSPTLQDSSRLLVSSISLIQEADLPIKFYDIELNYSTLYSLCTLLSSIFIIALANQFNFNI